MSHTPHPFRAPTAAELAVPRGLGMWVLDISERVMGTPAEAAAKAVEHGLSFVCLAACWQEGAGKHGVMNAADLVTYGAAFRKAGVLPYVWGYPGSEPEQIQAFVQHMRIAADAASAVGVVLDPEKAFRGKPAAMRDLLKRTIDSLGEGLGLGFSSYGVPSNMKDFPWAEAGGYGWGSPQCYQARLPQAREGIRQWSAFGWRDLVVSLPTFGANTVDAQGKPDPAKMLMYCSALLELTGGAGCFWQWRGTNDAEWRVIKMLAERDQIQSPAVSHTDHRPALTT